MSKKLFEVNEHQLTALKWLENELTKARGDVLAVLYRFEKEGIHKRLPQQVQEAYWFMSDEEKTEMILVFCKKALEMEDQR